MKVFKDKLDLKGCKGVVIKESDDGGLFIFKAIEKVEQTFSSRFSAKKEYLSESEKRYSLDISLPIIKHIVTDCISVVKRSHSVFTLTHISTKGTIVIKLKNYKDLNECITKILNTAYE